MELSKIKIDKVWAEKYIHNVLKEVDYENLKQQIQNGKINLVARLQDFTNKEGYLTNNYWTYIAAKELGIEEI